MSFDSNRLKIWHTLLVLGLVIVGCTGPKNETPAVQSTKPNFESSYSVWQGRAIEATLPANGSEKIMVEIEVAPKSGRLELNGLSFHYIPNENFVGMDEFRLRFKREDGSVESYQVRVTVNGLMAANSLRLETPEDTKLNVVLSIEGGYVIAKLPSHGVLSGQVGNLKYMPEKDFFGEDFFTIRRVLSHSISDESEVKIVVTAVDDPTIALNSTVNTLEDTTVNTGFMVAEVDQDSLEYTVLSGPSHGAIQDLDTAKGTFRYVPNQNENGQDEITFQAWDGHTLSLPAKVTIHIGQQNDAPVVGNLTINVTEDTNKSFSLLASDPEGDQMVIRIKPRANPLGHFENVQSDALYYYPPQLIYTPDPNRNGTDEISILVSDGSLSTEMKLTINVAPVNDAPVVTNANIPTYVTETGESRIPLYQYFSDVDRTALTYQVTDPPKKGAFRFDSQFPDVVFYTPTNTCWAGNDTIKVQASDEDYAVETTIGIRFMGQVTQCFGTNGNTVLPATIAGKATDSRSVEDSKTLVTTLLGAFRLNFDGTWDASFNSTGFLKFDLSGLPLPSGATSVRRTIAAATIAPDQSFFLGINLYYSINDYDSYLRRSVDRQFNIAEVVHLLADGRLDPVFGNGTSVQIQGNVMGGLFLLPNADIIAVGKRVDAPIDFTWEGITRLSPLGAKTNYSVSVPFAWSPIVWLGTVGDSLVGAWNSNSTQKLLTLDGSNFGTYSIATATSLFSPNRTDVAPPIAILPDVQNGGSTTAVVGDLELGFYTAGQSLGQMHSFKEGPGPFDGYRGGIAKAAIRTSDGKVLVATQNQMFKFLSTGPLFYFRSAHVSYLADLDVTKIIRIQNGMYVTVGVKKSTNEYILNKFFVDE